MANVSVSGTVSVANGGTGATTLADGGLVIGNVANAVEVVVPGTTSQILIGGGAATKPAWGAPATISIGVLNVAAEWTKQQNFNEINISAAAASPPWDLDAAQCAYLDLETTGQATTVPAPSNQKAGSCYTLRVIQGSGVETLAWNAVFKFGTGVPDEPAADGDVVIFSFYSDGSTMYGVDAVREEA